MRFIKTISIAKYRLQAAKNLIASHNTGLYASQAAFFFVISLIPTTLLLATMIRFTPITYENIHEMIERVFPDTIQGMVAEIVGQVFRQARHVIPTTIFIALWAAGRGVLSLASAFNKIYGCVETRNYLFLRLRASLYTILFLAIIILTLVVSVFGNSIRFFIHEYAPFLIDAVDLVVRMRTGVTFVVLTIAISIIYKFLPSWIKTNKTTIRKQLPGAIIATSSWMMLSYVFSVYLDIFTRFSTIYGRMTTVVLLMLWFYTCMHAMLFGAKMNVYICRRFFDSK